jgi:dTDP-glucose 4,6-dehydratase
MSNQRYLILGSNSNAGNHFVNYCVEKDLNIVQTSRSVMNEDKFLANISIKKAPFYKVDLNKDIDHLRALCNDYQPTTIINFASQSMVAESWDHPKHWIQTNISATLELFELLREQKKLEKYIHFSTPEVYGNASGEVNENYPFNPSTPYAVTRACGDMFAKIWNKQHKVPTIITRAANVYGEGQKLYRIIPKTIHCLKNQIKIPLHGGGVTRRSFIHSWDVADALKVISDRGIIGKTYHIVGDNYLSIRDLVEKICITMDYNFDLSVKVSPDRLGKDLDYSLASNNLSELGWRASVPLDVGIKKVIKWYEKNLNNFESNDIQYHHIE